MHLSVGQCRARFAGARVARLGTVTADGAPRLVPIAFALSVRPTTAGDSRDVIVSAVDHKPKSTTDLARLRRIAREPRVTLLADVYAEDWSQLWWVRADAHAEVLTAGRHWEIAVALLQAKYEQYRDRPLNDAVIWAVVQRWTGWAADRPQART